MQFDKVANFVVFTKLVGVALVRSEHFCDTAASLWDSDLHHVVPKSLFYFARLVSKLQLSNNMLFGFCSSLHCALSVAIGVHRCVVLSS